MNDPAPTPPTPEAQTRAQARMTEISDELRVLAAPQGSEARQKLIDEFQKESRTANYQPPPAPSGPSWREEREHRRKLAELRADLQSVDKDSPEAAKIRVAMEASTREFMAKSAAPSTVHPLTASMPKEIQGEGWVQETLTAAEPHGIATFVPGLLYAAQQAAETGQAYTDDECIEALVAKHGEERATEIEHHARELAKHLPSSTRNWLASKRLLAHPDLVEHAASVWKRRHAAGVLPDVM